MCLAKKSQKTGKYFDILTHYFPKFSNFHLWVKYPTHVFLSSGIGASTSYFIGRSVGLSVGRSVGGRSVKKNVKNCQKEVSRLLYREIIKTY